MQRRSMRARRFGRLGRDNIQRIAAVSGCGLLLVVPGPMHARGPSRAAPASFHTVRPGHKLPNGAEWTKGGRAGPGRKKKGVNRRFNRTTGQHVGKTFFAGDKALANKWIAPRIFVNVTATTE